MSKYLENKKVNAYRKRLQRERRINAESKNAPMTAAERMRRMRQRRQVEATTSRADAATPDASSQAMDVDSEIEPMECDGRYPSILDSIVYRMFMSANVY
jgi:hypothetical protein